MFRRIWRNPKTKLALELTSGVVATIVVGIAVLNPIDQYFNVSLFGNAGWLEYAFYGVCGMIGWSFWRKNHNDQTATHNPLHLTSTNKPITKRAITSSNGSFRLAPIPDIILHLARGVISS